jgi:outer membrane receptor protein involved in Fe transport
MTSGFRRGLGRALACALACCASASLLARAEEPTDELGSLRLEDLMEIQVEAPSKQPLPLRDAPTVGAAISREQIETYGWVSANDVLFRQPGFAPSQDFERTTVTARGLHESWNNNHLLLLVDGVPHNNNVNLSAYTWDITPLYMVETMEVTRGPGSALYGTTAVNGIVALHTVTASNDRQAAAQLRVGNDGRRIYDLMAAHVFTPFSFVVAYNHTESDGNHYMSYDGSGRVDAFGRLQKFETNDKTSSDYVFAKIEGKGNLTGLSLQFHYQYWKFGTGQGWLFNIPDQPEHMATNVQILSLSYRPHPFLRGRLQSEFLLMWQRQEVDYHARFDPAGTPQFPDGLTEVLDNETNVLFARAQLTWRVWRDISVLCGVEDRLFIYTGDHNHEATADLTSGGTQLPFPGNQLTPLPPALEPIVNRPVDNVGVYAQVATGRILRRMLSITAGLRYDIEAFSYEDLTSAARPVASKTFQQLSPRLAILVHPWRDTLVFKAMVERAFRAPAPSELFGANTYFITSNINRTKPEELTVVTLAGDFAVLSHLDLRLDWYWQRNDNPIDFSVASPNLATNLDADTITGIEAEVLWDAPLSSLDLLSGFVNYTWAHLLDEQVIDTTLMKSKVLAWAPEHVFNLGVAFNGHGFGASLQGHYQGRVFRRPSDSLEPDGTVSPFAAYRPASVAPWFTLDARLSYRITEWLKIGVQGTNVLNTKGFFIKTNRYPFDYQIEGARVLGTLEVALKLRGH